ncbi:MSCRAMM family protein [Floccifex sp.]|uniref:MSCRAMM family protein n=1 Tax=Floccifex sp. TaxID=2815810 RepID=UPI003F0E869B
MKKILTCFFLFLLFTTTIHAQEKEHPLSLSQEEQDILMAYENGNKDAYIEQRKQIVDQINAYAYVDENYFVTDAYYEYYDTLDTLIYNQGAILIDPEYEYQEGSPYLSFYADTPIVTYFWQGSIVSIQTSYGTLTMDGGQWAVNGNIAYCGNANYAPPRLGDQMNEAVDVSSNENLRKAMYYGMQNPGDRITSSVSGNLSKAAVITNELVSYAYSNTTVAGTATNGNHMIVKEYNWIFNLPSPPSNFKIYAVSSNKTGTNWQGITTKCQTLIYSKILDKGTLTIEKASTLPEVTDNNACYDLNGAIYGIYTDSNCKKLIAEYETGKEDISLDAGSYYVKEIKAPPGFELNSRIYSISIQSNQNTILNVEDNPCIELIEPLLIKKDTDIPLSAVQYQVHYYDTYSDIDPANLGFIPKKSWIFQTDENGEIYLDDSHRTGGDALFFEEISFMPLGTFTIQEIQPKNGYILDSNVYVTQITKENLKSYIPYSFQNHKNQITFKKVQSNSSTVLPGVQFLYTDSNENTQILTTDENGEISLKGISKGKHSLQEIQSLPNYKIQSDSIDFEVKNDGIYIDSQKVDEYVIENDVKDFQLVIHKVNEKNEPLDGISFILYDQEKMEEKTSDAQGNIVFSNLKNRHTYYLKEIQTKEGYQIDDHEYTIEIDCIPYTNEYNITIDGKKTNQEEHVIQMIIQNKKILILPKTGSNTHVFMICLGSFLMLFTRRNYEK